MDKTKVDTIDSILLSIKKLLGYTKEQTGFDEDIIMHINTAFFNLYKLGVGPKEGFSIVDDAALWTEFVSKDILLSASRSYVYMKVRLVFDPPSNSAVVDSIKKSISELEWLINNEVESSYNKKEEMQHE